MFTGQVIADADGFIAIEPAASDGQPGVRRLIGLGVTADQPPRVRVTTPGRDLYFADANRTIDVAIEADDDLALDSLRLRFTKVAGSGENFTFTDGEAPLAVTRDNDRAWKARGSLKLDTLELAAGDMVVYRGVASDRRPGTTPVESDTFIVEILAPGAVAAEGFAMDDQRDRYAISQQMVILKTERLLARKPSLPPETFAADAAGLAAEQRQVRAEFVFMMGGELAEELVDTSSLTELNEEAEAAGEADLAAGLLANQGRADSDSGDPLDEPRLHVAQRLRSGARAQGRAPGAGVPAARLHARAVHSSCPHRARAARLVAPVDGCPRRDGPGCPAGCRDAGATQSRGTASSPRRRR